MAGLVLPVGPVRQVELDRLRGQVLDPGGHRLLVPAVGRGQSQHGQDGEGGNVRARRRFADDGYAATTVRDIADDAGGNVALTSGT